MKMTLFCIALLLFLTGLYVWKDDWNQAGWALSSAFWGSLLYLSERKVSHLQKQKPE